MKLKPHKWNWPDPAPAATWLSAAGADFPVVWLARLTGDAAQLDVLATTLSPDETARLARWKFDADRRRFLVGRGLLRRLLGLHLKIAPAQIRFTEGPHGKPMLADGRVQFNVSHGGEIVLLGFHLTRAVGVDVEPVRAMDNWEAIARRMFSEAEVRALQNAEAKDRAEKFFQTWTRHEAQLKALGTGLAGKIPAPGPAIADLELPPGHCGAVSWMAR